MSQPNSNPGFGPDRPGRSSANSRGALEPPPWPEMLRRMEAVGALDAPRCGCLPISIRVNDASYRQVLNAPRRARRLEFFAVRATQLLIVVLCFAFWGEVVTVAPRFINHPAAQSALVEAQSTAGPTIQEAARDRWAEVLIGRPLDRAHTSGMPTPTGVARRG